MDEQACCRDITYSTRDGGSMGRQLKSSADEQEQVKVLHDGVTQAGCSTSRRCFCSWRVGTEANTGVMVGRGVLSVEESEKL
jgi:hypothetical protein